MAYQSVVFFFKAPVYDWNPQIQGIIFSAINYGMILTLAPSGYLAGRVGTKPVVGAALLGPWRRTRGSLRSWSCLGRKPPRALQLEETPETPPSSRADGLFLHGLESNPGSSLQTEEEAGLP